MTYNLMYTVPFRSLAGVQYEVKVESLGYQGEAVELVGGETPFTSETDEDDLYLPMRLSKATLSVYGSDYLQSLYASNPQGVRIRLYKNGMPEWYGFLTPDTFSQDFSNPEFIYDMECVCALSTLKYKKFNRTEETVTFLQIIQDAAFLAGYNSIYVSSAVHIPETGELIESATIATANFYDELGEAMTYYEVLEEIAKFMGCTFTVYKDAIWLVDYAAIRKGINTYRKYTGAEKVDLVVSDEKTIQELGYKGTGATLSRIPGKNKASVSCSLYEMDSVLPEFDNEQSTYLSMVEFDKTYTENKKSSTYKGIIRYYEQPRFSFYKSVENAKGGYDWVEHHGSVVPEKLGSCFVRTASYNTENTPSKLDFADEVLICTAKYGTHWMAVDRPVIKIKTTRSIVTNSNVYLCINFSVKFVPDGERFAHPSVTNGWTFAGTKNVRCILRLGEYYYNGTSWQTGITTFPVALDTKKGDPISNRYYPVKNTNNYTLGIGDLSGRIIQCPPYIINGECELTICDMDKEYPGSLPYYEYQYIKGISLDYAIPDASTVYSDWVKDGSKNDVSYENLISDDYVEEADEIDLKICTNTDSKLCLSSVMANRQYLQNIRSEALNKEGIAEELLIERMVSLFSKPRYQIDPTVTNSVKPYSLLTDLSLPDSRFLVAGGAEDYKMDSVRLNLIEM
ncbi:hypothetical protein [Bacteroides sedimenti]|uniref:Uncharacterized protein n=1 Tax=Bacteroides sedimenti TaxID=2136147 RepID=A0ABN6Z0H7_9BACE